MDWINFFKQNGINYVSHGNNVAKDHVNIKCPFCGNDDPSEHMGVNLTADYWGCWRNRNHRGEAPQRLIMQLVRCSYSRACEIAGRANMRDLSEFEAVINNLRKVDINEPARIALESLCLPDNFREVRAVGNGISFINYLVEKRGFHRKDIKALVKRYDLRYCMSGRWKGRLIIPLYFEEKLVSWVARSIYPRENLRYMNLTTDFEKARERGDPVGLLNPKSILFNFDELWEEGGDTLFVTEGPMDALKIDFYGQFVGARATCLFGLTYTDAQEILLDGLVSKFDRVRILLDEGTLHQSIELQNRLVSKKVRLAKLPMGVSDPGDLSEDQVYALNNSCR